MKFNKNKILVSLVVMGILVFTFWYGGNAPGLQGWKVKPEHKKQIRSSKVEDEIDKDKLLTDEEKKTEEEKDDKELEVINKEEKSEEEKDKIEAEKKTEEKAKDDKKLEDDKKPEKSRPGGTEGGLSAAEKIKLAKEMSGGSSAGVEKGSESYSKSMGMEVNPKTGKDKYLTDPVPEGKPVPMEPQNTKITDIERSCTLSVRCDTILDNIDWLNPEKVELVPKDGVIFANKKVNFYEGESVFNLLLREMKRGKIHMEFSNTPMYNSAYIEGINNLYEFDCGELSGWMYKVNNWFPNYGCSRYVLKEGDVVEWVYTCDLGNDVGGFSAIGGE